jgi:hypothetical protein
MRGVLAAAVAIVAVAAPASALARPVLGPMPGVQGPVLTTDNRTTAAMFDSAGRVILVSPAGRRHTPRFPPAHCASPAVSSLVAANAGYLLFSDCTRGGEVLDRATGEVTEVPRKPPGPPENEPDGEGPGDVGAQWVRIDQRSYHNHGYLYVNWHTGEERYPSAPWPKSYPDLDRPGLARPVCGAVRRLPVWDGDAYDSGPTDPHSAYTGRWGLVQTDFYSWVLQRCGARKPLVRIYCPCSDPPQLGGGFVTWVRPGDVNRVYALRLRDGHRFTWRYGNWLARVTHVSDRIFVELRTRTTGRHRFLTARLPR